MTDKKESTKSVKSGMSPAQRSKMITGGIIVVVIIGLVVLLKYGLGGDAVPQEGLTVDPVKGGENAVVKIVEYSDFQCPACGKMAPLLDKAVKEFGDDISVEYNDFPLTQIHDNSFEAAESAQCAYTQGKFWEYHDKLFSNQVAWAGESSPTESFKKYADELKLDKKSFETCLSEHETRSVVREDMAEAEEASISSTPTLFINDERYAGVGSYDSLAQKIREHLEKGDTPTESDEADYSEVEATGEDIVVDEGEPAEDVVDEEDGSEE
ncbi:MAG: DsbA family protein [bacterium]|nr:DsbA family protein [bacterium]